MEGTTRMNYGTWNAVDNIKPRPGLPALVFQEKSSRCLSWPGSLWLAWWDEAAKEWRENHTNHIIRGVTYWMSVHRPGRHEAEGPRTGIMDDALTDTGRPGMAGFSRPEPPLENEQ